MGRSGDGKVKETKKHRRSYSHQIKEPDNDSPCSGSVLRSFTSVCTASLHSSGLAAAYGMTYNGAAVRQNPISTINQNTRGQGNVEMLQPDLGICGNEKCESVTGLRDSTFIRSEVHGQTHSHDTEISQMNMQEMFRDETKRRIKNSRVRKLIYEEDTPTGEIEAISKITTTMGKVDPPRFLMSEHEVAGLSYVGSQEPGVELQTNALSVVDKFLLLHDVELTGEGNTGVPLGWESLPVPSAKGAQSVAKRACLRGPDRNTGVFDWVDSREDESGGDFFRKRKGVLYEDMQSRKPKHLSFKGVQNAVDKYRETAQESGTEIHQKIMGLTCPDMRSMLRSSTESDKRQITEKMTRKSSFPELCGQSNVESSGERSGADADDSSLQGMDGIGVKSTQLAVEALEALVCGPPANHGIAQELPVTRKVTAGSKKNKCCSKHVSAKRGCCMSDSDGTMRQSKHNMMLHSNLSEGNYEPEEHLTNSGTKLLWQKSPVKTRAMIEKQRYKEHFGEGKSAKINKYLVEKSSRNVKIGQSRGALTGACNEKVDKCHTSLISDSRLSFGKSLAEEELPRKIVEPIVHRTRHSMMNSLKRTKIPSIDCMQATNCSRDNDNLQNIIVVNCNADAPAPLTKVRSSPRLGPNQNSKIGMNESQFEKQPMAEGLHEEKFQISDQKKDASSYNKGRKTRRSMSDNLDNTSNSNVPSATNDSVMKANAQISALEKSSKTNAMITFLSSNTDTVKRRTRSAVRSTLPPLPMTVLPKPDVALCSNMTREVDSLASETCEPSMDQMTSGARRVPIVSGIRRRSSRISCMSMSSDNKSTEILIRDKSLKSGTVNCAVDCSMDVTNDKAPTEHMILPTTGAQTVPESDDGADSSTLPVKGSPKERIPKETTALSPVCTGDDPEKLSGKRCLTRSSLIGELIRLDTSAMTQTHAVKDMRWRRDMASVSVLFSHHLGEDIIKQQKKILAQLGASLASSSSVATHFIADKFVRTRNMLEAMALGKPVVTHFWLETCGQASCFIDEKGYILRDRIKEREMGFSMPVSLAHAREKPLLQRKKVYITPNVKPDREVVASLVKAVRGQAIGRIGRYSMKGDTVPNDLLVISCEDDYSICIPFLEKGAEIYDSELLLNGIVIQKLEHERHRLFMDHVKRTRSTIWLRKEASNQFHPVTRCK